MNCQGEVVEEKGTFISISQDCAHCGYQYRWNSQPFMKDTPAGNILLSAAILFSGSTPGIFFIFWYACMLHASRKEDFMTINPLTFNQPYYRYGKINKDIFFLNVPSETPHVIIGGDRRADSPGDSAKYGSYSIIDLETDKVVHIELVQVTLVMITP